MSFTNRYRDHLSGERPYQKYLGNNYMNGNADEERTGRRMVTAGIGLAAVAGAGVFAFRKGRLKGLIRKGISLLSEVRTGDMGATFQGLRQFAYDLGDRDLGHSMANLSETVGLARKRVGDARRAHAEIRHRLGDTRLRTAEFTELEQFLSQAHKAREEYALLRVGGSEVGNARRRFDGHVKTHMGHFSLLDTGQQAEMMRTTGVRYATMRDLMDRGELQRRWHNVEGEGGMGDLVREAQITYGDDFLDRRADANIFVDESGQIRDLRGARNKVKDTVRSLEGDFQVPFVGLNPLRMFRVGEMMGVNKFEEPFVTLFSDRYMQPGLTGQMGALGRNIAVMGDKAIDLDTGEVVKEGGRLVRMNSAEARYMRRLGGAPATEYKRTKDGPRGWWASLAERLDLGFQDEPGAGQRGVTNRGTHLEGADEAFSWWLPHTWGDELTRRVKEKFWRPYDGAPTAIPVDLQFADPQYRREVIEAAKLADQGKAQRDRPEQYLWLSRAKSVDEAGGYLAWLKQFFPEREHMNETTTYSFLPISPYVMMDRLEGYFAKVHLGFSADSTGSAGDILRNLLTKRVAPVIGGVTAWSYLNYESEQIIGEEESPEHWAADAYVGAAVDMARLRDSLGITDWARHTAHLFPGGHNISELPFIGNLTQLNLSAEETEDYWKNGEDPVRKGRFWRLGNTPYVGGKVDWYQPNWYRRMKADVPMTDTLYGSEDEYWAHHWLPTPRYPMAPLRRIVTDRTWLEEKHRDHRPYPIVGGDPVLAEMPVMGSALEGTIGRLMGAGTPMHTDDYAAEGELVNGVPGVPVKTRPGRPAVIMPTHQEGKLVASDQDGDGEARKAIRVAYITASGQITPMIVSEADLGKLSQLTAGRSAESLGLVESKPRKGAPPEAEPVAYEDPTALDERMKQLGSDMKQLYGFYGFALDALSGEASGDTGERMATSRAMTSWRRQFQDMNVGGEDFLFGGEVSEVVRRFWPRENFADNFNPIENTMPEWLPGDGAWANFRRGDPYLKVQWGEGRLPGAGYEQLHGIAGGQYSLVDQLRVLADVAPYSQEYRDVDAQVSQLMAQPGGTTTDQEREIREIRRQVREKRKSLSLTPYRFQGETERMEVTVTKVIEDPRSGFMFMTEEMPDNPVKLAGVKVSMSQTDLTASAARERLRSVIHEGARLSLDVDADPLRRIKDDTYRTVGAAVYDEDGRNVARSLVRDNLAKEDEDDFSAPAVLNRFSSEERVVGKAWEAFAHLDTPLHTKFLQVRSPLEQYERQDVYGKQWQTWDSPWQDYVVPTFESLMNQHPIISSLIGGYIGSRFGRTAPGRMIGALVGSSLMGGSSLYRSAKEVATGQEYIPERREKERAVDEYFDILEFLKHQGLARHYADLAREREGFEVEAFVAQQEAKGEQNAARRRALEDAKRELMMATSPDVERAKRFTGIQSDAADPKAMIKEINREIRELAAQREVVPMTPLAAKALEHMKAAKRTSYGWNPGDSVQDAMVSLSKREKEYLTAFMDAPEEERARILEVVPLHMRRVLQSTWGVRVDKKPELQQYFKTRFLPGAEWAGWHPGVNMEDVKIKFIAHEGMDRSSFELWPDDMERADREPTPVPRAFSVREHAATVRNKLVDILQAAGYEEVEVEVLGPARGIQVDVDMRKDKQKELEQYLEANRGGWL